VENQARAGMVIGSVVGVLFGLVFVEVNSGELPGPWSVVVRVLGVLVAAILLVGIAWVARNGQVEGEVPSGGLAGRRYWNIVGLVRSRPVGVRA
jgi:heme/copper-type cytochrome/quinol oxidase subunit 4